jgi:hypothetical protein
MCAPGTRVNHAHADLQSNTATWNKLGWAAPEVEHIARTACSHGHAMSAPVPLSLAPAHLAGAGCGVPGLGCRNLWHVPQT